ncbi:MAG: V-type ATP synthase subunit F [Thermodesulfobacteriota bacterium]
MSNKVAVIGDRDSILIFKGLDISVFPVKDAENIPSLIESLSNDGYIIIFITEEYREGLGSFMEERASQTLPSIIPIPSHNGSTGIGKAIMQELVKKATGTDMLKESEV